MYSKKSYTERLSGFQQNTNYFLNSMPQSSNTHSNCVEFLNNGKSFVFVFFQHTHTYVENFEREFIKCAHFKLPYTFVGLYNIYCVCSLNTENIENTFSMENK